MPLLKGTSPKKKKKSGCLTKSILILGVFIMGLVIGAVFGFYLSQYHLLALSTWTQAKSAVGIEPLITTKLESGLVINITEFQRHGERVDLLFSLRNDSQGPMRFRPVQFPLIGGQGHSYQPWTGVKELVDDETLGVLMRQQPREGEFNPGYGPDCCYHLVYRIPPNIHGLQLKIGNIIIPLE